MWFFNEKECLRLLFYINYIIHIINLIKIKREKKILQNTYTHIDKNIWLSRKKKYLVALFTLTNSEHHSNFLYFFCYLLIGHHPNSLCRLKCSATLNYYNTQSILI